MTNNEYEKDNAFGLETESEFHNARIHGTIKIILDYGKNNPISNILDVGCGVGTIVKRVHEVLPDCLLDAFDISLFAVSRAKENTKNINYFVADADAIPIIRRKYQVVLLNNIYEHVENPVKILREIRKILLPQGIVIISTPNRYHLKNILKVILGKTIVIPSFHITEYSIGQIRDHHRAAGLRVDRFIMPEIKYKKGLSNGLLINIIQMMAERIICLFGIKQSIRIMILAVSKIDNNAISV